jgi:hypothetical protein
VILHGNDSERILILFIKIGNIKNLVKMQEVVINHRTKIYIAVGADPEEARDRYQARQDAKGKVLIMGKKPAIT